jgi:hypothetical protein
VNTDATRMTRIEERSPRIDRRFVGWISNPWTPEQMAAAIRRHPQQRVFWRSRREAAGEEIASPGLGVRDLAPVTAELDKMTREQLQAMGVVLNYAPHAAQLEIHRARDKRFKMVCTGRRFGKTLCLAAELLDRGGCERGGDYGWVAPTYNVADRGIEAFRAIGCGFVQECGRAPARVEFQGRDGLKRTRVWFLSADNPDNIRGFGFQGLVIDEAASIPPDVWDYVLRPTIAQTLGWAMLVSTPKGRNWFYDLFTRGLDPTESQYASFSFPSKASPFFPASEWEESQRIMPENVFRQEFQAEFMEDCAGVFKGVDACLLHPGAADGNQTSAASGDVVIGCDLAKHKDWTVLIAVDAETGRCLAMDRFNQLSWPIQKERIVAFSRRWRGRLILDATGIGDPVYDDLSQVLRDIEPFKLTATNKPLLIQRLMGAVEQRQISWPAVGNQQGDWDVLTAEMKRFEYEFAPLGGIRYGAPAGYHDDCVLALALAVYRKWETGRAVTMYPLPAGRGLFAHPPGIFRRRSRILDGV